MRILGLDYGAKKIGLAFADSASGIAVPLDVVTNRGEETLKAFANKVATEDIDIIVVGVPLSVGGHHSPVQLEKTRAFIQALKAVTDVPIEEEDESYTTTESLRLKREEGAEADEDALAAMLILRAYLERAPK